MKWFGAILFTMLLAGAANAAPIVVHDHTGVMGAQAGALAREAGWQFEYHVFTGTYATASLLDEATHKCVTRPNVVCAGVDPVQHRTRVHFGTATGVRPVDYDAIAAAGNYQFKTGNWIGGFEMIANRATESIASARPSITVAPVVVREQHASGWGLLFLVLFIVAVLTTLFFILRWQYRVRKRLNSLDEERNEYLSANVKRITDPEPAPTSQASGFTRPSAPANPGPATFSSSPSPAPAPSQVIVNQRSGGSSGDFATGLILGNMMSTPRVVEREVIHERPSYSSRRDDDDAGGGGSSWGGSSYDSGGSDDGGSSDSGGWDSGGSDSGGGGSDW